MNCRASSTHNAGRTPDLCFKPAFQHAGDGIGLDSAGTSDGHGLEGLRQRCQDNGADLTIEAPSSGSGTVLRVSARRLSSRMTHDAIE